MQEILDQIITPEVRMVIYLMVICVVMLYILSIIYVIRDAQRRGAEPWWMWAVISVVPVVEWHMQHRHQPGLCRLVV